MTAAPPVARGDDAASSSAAGPGRLLRAARESAGIALRDVAAQMHLDESMMTALESDAFGELPAPTFVRGYLRGYARLLGVPVGPVMEAYDREGFAPPDLVADIAEKPQAQSGDFPVRVTTYVVVLVLAALVVAWWHNQGFDEPVAIAPAPVAAPDTTSATRTADATGAATTPPPSPPATGPAEPGTSPAAPDARPQTQSGPPVAASKAPDGPGVARPDTAAPAATGGTSSAGGERAAERRAQNVLSEAERVLERTRSELDAAARAPQRARERADAPGTGPAPPPASATGAATDPGTASAPPADPAASSGTARLRVRFPEEAWVEIYDRNGQRLFYNLVTPGRELDLQGPPPLRVLLGRTRGVQVEYNGEPVDLAPHTDRGVARFTLGE
jgi:cytoskeleton protein RodZ